MLNDLAEQRGQTLAEMALAWLLKDNRVTSVIIGASSVTQLKDNLKALDNAEFTPDELCEIDSKINCKSRTETTDLFNCLYQDTTFILLELEGDNKKASPFSNWLFTI